jgi:hypothetical protein
VVIAQTELRGEQAGRASSCRWTSCAGSTATCSSTNSGSFTELAGEAPEEPPSEQAERAEQDEPTRVCRKCKCGTLVLRAQKARPTVDYLMSMPPDA